MEILLDVYTEVINLKYLGNTLDVFSTGWVGQNKKRQNDVLSGNLSMDVAPK